MSGFDILSLVGEPWNDSSGVFGGISVTVNDVASFPSSKFLELFLNGSSVYRILKTGETIISNPTGSSLGGMRLAGDGGMMALTSQMDVATGQPAQALSYFWENPAEVGYNPRSEAVLQGMGSARFSVKSQATFSHTAGNSRYEWQGVVGPRIQWTGLAAATSTGMTIDFTNVGQSPRRASPVVSFSAANLADDLVHFGLSDGSNWAPRAKVDAAGGAQFQMLDLPEQSVPGDPAAATARLYALRVDGVTSLAFRDSSGAETVLAGAAGNVVSSTGTAATGKAVDSEGHAVAAPNGQATPADLTVGGESGQVQYNDAGVLAGLTGMTVTAGAASALALTGGTATTPSPVLSVSQTWNGTPNTFHPFEINVTDNGSHFTSTVFRARINGVDRFQLTRDDALVFGPYDGSPVGFRRLSGSGIALCTLLSNNTGKLAPVFGAYWLDVLPNGRANEEVSVLHGFGTKQFKVESLAEMSHMAENGYFRWEVGWEAPTGRLLWSGYEKQSTEGRTIDFNDFLQSPRASPVVSFSSAGDSGDLVHFSKWTGSDWIARGKVDVMGRATFQALDLPEQSEPENPAPGTGRLYATQAEGATRLAFRDALGAEMVLGDTAPGGANGAIQYNNNGVFGGAAGIGITSDVVTQIAITGGTATSSNPVLATSQTWNNATETFYAFDANITDTASHYTSAFFRGRVDGIDRFQVTRDDTLMFGPYDNQPIGIRRLNNGAVLGLCTLLSATSGKLAPVVSLYWDSTPLAGGRANETVAVIRGNGSNRLSIESDSAIVHIAETGRYEWEAGFANNTDRISWVGYQKSSSEGRPFDFNNFGQAPTRANPIASFSSDVDEGDLVHFSNYDGSIWTPRGKVDAMGRASFQALDLPEQADPGLPGPDTGRLYARDVDGLTRLAFRTAAGVETLLGAGTATEETIVPDRTIILYDAAGNAYKVPCVAA